MIVLVEIEAERVGASFRITRLSLRWLLHILQSIGVRDLVLCHGLVHDHLLDSLDDALMSLHDLKIDLLVCGLRLSKKAGLCDDGPVSSEQDATLLASVGDSDKLLFHKDPFVD